MNYLEKSEAFRKSLLNEEKKAIEILKQFPEGKMEINHQFKQNKDYCFFRVKNDDGTRTSITRDSEAIRQMSLKKYYEIKLDLIRINLNKVEMIMANFEDYSHNAIIKKLPPEILPFINHGSTMNLRLPSDPILHDKINAWLNTPYKRNPAFPEELKHTASDGTLLRSKSEIVIYEKLLAAGTAFKVEFPVTIGGREYYPDFTIMRADGKIMYWEHCGLMCDPDYAAGVKKKLSIYEKAGITIWDNLILTFDDPDGNLDVRIIESEIRNKLLINS